MAVSCPEEADLYSAGKQLELIFTEFFDYVMTQQFSLESEGFVRNVLTTLKAICNSKSLVPVTTDFIDVTFEDAYTRCGYTYAYSVLHCVMVMKHFVKFLKENVEIRNKLVSMKKFRLCCLGGGPAVEAVAICKVLNDLLKKFGHKKRPPLEVYVTVIDKCESWEKDASAVVKSIEKNKHLCTGETMKISFGFIKADLIHSFTPDVRSRIKKAHFVTMVKFLPILYNTNSNLRLHVCSMVNKVLWTMKVGGCAFFIDNARYGFFEEIDKMIGKLSICDRKYRSCFNNHVLRIKTAETHTEFFETLSRAITCTVRTTVSCSVWIKTKKYDPRKKKSVEGPKLDKDKTGNSWKKDIIKPVQYLKHSQAKTRADKQKRYEEKRMQKFLLEANDDVRDE